MKINKLHFIILILLLFIIAILVYKMNSINYEKFQSNKTYKFTLFGDQNGSDYKKEPSFLVYYNGKTVNSTLPSNQYKNIMKGTPRTSDARYFDYNFTAPIDKISSEYRNSIMAINGFDIPKKVNGRPYCSNLYFTEDGRILAEYYNKDNKMQSQNYVDYTSDCKPLCCPNAKTNKFQCNKNGICNDII